MPCAFLRGLAAFEVFSAFEILRAAILTANIHREFLFGRELQYPQYGRFLVFGVNISLILSRSS